MFNPGLGVLGGGERYMVALGEVISETHDVIYAAPNGRLPEPEALHRLGFPELKIMTLDSSDLPMTSLDYDLAVLIQTRLPPPSFAAHNLLVVQFPVGLLPTGRLQQQLALRHLRRYTRVVYSEFARRWLSKRWKVDAEVLAPGIELPPTSRLPKKDKVILAVGRFFADAHCKRQDVLVEAFSRLPERFRDTWRLVLAGGYDASLENEAFVERVRRGAQGLNVSIELNVPPERMAELQRRARLFWHATGFGRSSHEPERAEHFGLSTVEAMSHGAVPLVFADGGQPEVVTPEVGFLWESIPQLVEQTSQLMSCSAAELDARGRAAMVASQAFSLDRFKDAARLVVGRTLSQRSLPTTARRVLATLDGGGRRMASGFETLLPTAYRQQTS